MKILSLCGGGVRCITTAKILEGLILRKPDLVRSADLITGTSAGGLLALFLAARPDLDPEKLPQFFERFCYDVFQRKTWFGAKYSIDALRQCFIKALEELDVDPRTQMMGLRKQVLIPAFNIQTWKPKFYDNTDACIPLVDVACATCAAPTFFPTYGYMVDGGVIANNPSMCALAYMYKLGFHVDTLLCIETPKMKPSLRPNSWGILGWGKHFSHLLVDAQEQTVRYHCQQLLGDRYIEILPTGVEDYEMDDVSRIYELRQLAYQADYDTYVKQLWQKGW